MRKNNNSVNRQIEKSTLIWHYSNGFSKEIGDIRWAFIDLYRTTSGEYWLHVCGGPGSDYAGHGNITSAWCDGIIYTDGEDIISMSQEDVIVWGEEYLPEDILRKIFQDIRKKAKQKKKAVPKILKLSERKLFLREKETKSRLAAARADAEVQACKDRYYEQFVEL